MDNKFPWKPLQKIQFTLLLIDRKTALHWCIWNMNVCHGTQISAASVFKYSGPYVGVMLNSTLSEHRN
jgi:hypothetical protein